MLGSTDVVKLLASRGAAGMLPHLVVDPVFVSSSGKPIFGGEDLAGAYRELFARAAVVTPNLPEAALLTGRPIADLEAMEAAARELQGLGPSLVVVKGGRRRDTDAVDVAFDGRSVTLLRAPWIDTPNVHGTGCTFAAAIQPTWLSASSPCRRRCTPRTSRDPGDPGRLSLAARHRPRAARPDGGRPRKG